MQPDEVATIVAGGMAPSDDVLALVGGKAFGLLKLAAMQIPVPEGFVLPTSMCAAWLAGETPSRDEFARLVSAPLERVERACGFRFGDSRRPLVVSVRSGAAASMPGMLDTVLNVGLTKTTLPGLIAKTGNPRLAWDCYARFIASYAETVCGLDLAIFDAAARKALASADVKTTAELDTLALRSLALRYAEIFEDAAGGPLPDDPLEQLRRAVDAVFRSWNSERADSYRRINALEGLPGTAVTVQRMVYGNAGARSGAGVGFTRNPATGEKRLYVDFAFDAQGEDVVSGRRPLSVAADLARALPRVSESLELVAARLEQQFGDVQDFEFVVQQGELFLLQTRAAKRSVWARLKVAVDMADEGLISRAQALRRLADVDLSAVVRRRVIGAAGPQIAQGTAAGIGVASGMLALSVGAACAYSDQGHRTILVRNDIATSDIDGLVSADGVLTAHGGRTSHAAVVARELGKVAVVGCTALHVAADEKSCTIGERRLANGDEITLDGESGRVYVGRVEIAEERPSAELARIAAWKERPLDAAPEA